MNSLRTELPSVDGLPRDMREALNEVELLSDPQREGGWTNVIADAISRRVRKRRGVECMWSRDRSKPQEEREWLFDYCALFFEEAPDVRRFVSQALIIGEMEFSDLNGFDDDFEKLLVADSLIRFFCFPGWLEDKITEQLDTFQEAAERYQRYAKRRGMTTPPIFVLACYFHPGRRFIRRIVGEEFVARTA
ncbi:MAG: hypothetical protein ACR650_16640 [Methylocystis sp.]